MDNNKHDEIMRAIGRIEGRLEVLPKIEIHLATLNGRVGKLELFKQEIKTKTILISSIAGVVISVIISIMIYRTVKWIISWCSN